MFEAWRRGDDDSRDHAKQTARELLTHADLPLLIRARACMILGCSNDPDFIDQAEEGVRIAKIGLEQAGADAGELEKQLVEDCETVLREAREAQAEFEAAGGVRETGDVDVDEQQDDLEEDEPAEGDYKLVFEVDPITGETRYANEDGVIVAGEQAERMVIDTSTSDTAEMSDPAGPSSDLPDAADLPKASGLHRVVERPNPNANSQKKKKVRRIHSGDTDGDVAWEEYDQTTASWVDLGTASDPLFVVLGSDADDEMLMDG